jgi:hypothetical protein
MGASYSACEPPSKRICAVVEDALDDDGILQQVLEFAGPGQWLYLAKVSRKWRDCYAAAVAARRPTFGCVTYTSCNAVFSSTANLQLACKHGFNVALNDKSQLPPVPAGLVQMRPSHVQSSAGRAKLDVLQAAFKLGMQCTGSVAYGAVRDLAKLQWLYYNKKCPLKSMPLRGAAHAGVLEVVKWLIEQGLSPTQGVSAAVYQGHLHILDHLHSAGCELQESDCMTAARWSQLQALQWLRARNCPWDIDAVGYAVAAAGSMEILVWLQQQQGAVFTMITMCRAACAGEAALVHWLHANGCPWSEDVLCNAAAGAHSDLFKWLHLNGCPYEQLTGKESISWCAAYGGSVECLQYCSERLGAQWTVAQLTDMLRVAGCEPKQWTDSHTVRRLAALQWLLQQGAQWPAKLYYESECWCTELEEWALTSGCPVSATLYDDFDDDDLGDLVV